MQRKLSEKGERMQPQEKIYNAVVERGYHEGLSEQEFAAKQVAKLGEKFGELAEFVASRTWNQPWWIYHIRNMSRDCRRAFDCITEWSGMTIDVNGIRAELADVAVVVLLMSETISHITGQPFDVIQAAVEKAEKDVERGVR